MKYYSRFIVLGDSFSEGMCDDIDTRTHQYRGWADRVADGLGQHDANLTYLNLAIRGKLIRQVVEDQLPIALQYATYGNVLVSFHAGANDLLRPSYDHATATALYADTAKAIRATGADLMLFIVAEPAAAKGRAAQVLGVKIAQFNKEVRAVAAENSAILIEAIEVEILRDRRFWYRDRLHLNSLGHQRVAAAVLESLEYSNDSSWREPLPPASPKSKTKETIEDVIWAFTFFLPWVWRRLRGHSSGDGRSAKHTEPVYWMNRL